MQDPQPHPREDERLAELRQCGILDTPAEAEFDELIALAAHITGMPIALVSLVDSERQWFKARIGLGAAQTPRRIAFCAHAILTPDQPLVVEDARCDPRFAGNPIVDGEPYVISYVGMPLRIGDKSMPVGTLCVIDHMPRRLPADALVHLQALARQAERLIEQRRRQRQLEDSYVELHRREARIQAVLASMDEGLVVQNADGSIVSCNEAAQRILGLSADQMAGRTSLDPRWRAVRPDGSSFPGDQHPAMVALRTGCAVHDVVMGVGSGLADQRWILIHAQPLGGPPGGPAEQVVCSFSDITALRTKEVELTRARDAAEAAGQAKAEFLATMSHEIRTPMNGVIGLTEALLAADPRPDQREMLGSIQSSGRALMDILNDILDYSKIEAGRLHLEPADLDPMRVVRDVVTILSPQAAGKGLNLSTGQDADTPPAVRADPGRLRQVLFNLVGNAIKFTIDGSVSVHLSRVPGGCRFAVSDTGVGIAEADLPRLFQRFCQVDASPGRRHGGTGLGLAISRHLAEAMGGTITVASRPGSGSVFTVVIPAAAAPAVASTPAASELRAANRPMRLLVAEDNPVNQRVARALLGAQGHQIEMSANGIEAVAAWKSGSFDAIFMDVQMPEMDGLAATRTIRRLEAELARPRIPIFALTASAMTDERAACLAAGMDDLVAKPVTGAALAMALSRCP